MYEHHKKAIETITNKLESRSEVLGVILGGSVAHGFANEKSDIDLMIVLSDQEYERAKKAANISYYETEATPYEEGYVDGKYTSAAFIKRVIESGSEPARFAYKDAIVTYSEIPGLEQLVKDAARYPVERKQENMVKFYAQFEAWKWYYYEGLKRSNEYLMDFSLPNYVLFAGRLILAYNETLYPYHKWFLKVLESVEQKPAGLLDQISGVLKKKDPESVEALYNSITSFHNWTASDKHWSTHFMLDSELNWLDGPVPVADL
jgi:predicted nucleotidyltransferase